MSTCTFVTSCLACMIIQHPWTDSVPLVLATQWPWTGLRKTSSPGAASPSAPNLKLSCNKRQSHDCPQSPNLSKNAARLDQASPHTFHEIVRIPGCSFHATGVGSKPAFLHASSFHSQTSVSRRTSPSTSSPGWVHSFSP